MDGIAPTRSGRTREKLYRWQVLRRPVRYAGIYPAATPSLNSTSASSPGESIEWGAPSGRRTRRDTGAYDWRRNASAWEPHSRARGISRQIPSRAITMEYIIPVSTFQDSFAQENRALWRTAAQECLQGADPFGPFTWGTPVDIASVLQRLCVPNLSYALEPGGGGYEFVTAVRITGDFFHLTTQAGSRHVMQIAKMDYVPHPSDPADALFRLELTPAAVDESQGPVSPDGYRQGMPHPDGESADPWPDHRWLNGSFVFTAKKGLFNEVDPDASSWVNGNATDLRRILARLRHIDGLREQAVHPEYQKALQPLAASPLSGTMPPGWLDVWLEGFPEDLPPSAVREAVRYVLDQRSALPNLPEFRELCERARDGLPLSAPYVTEEEVNAQIILADLQKRYPDIEEGKLSDTLLIAAAALYMRAGQRCGVSLEMLVDGDFGPRARMFARATVGWAEQASRGDGAWSAFFVPPPADD